MGVPLCDDGTYCSVGTGAQMEDLTVVNRLINLGVRRDGSRGL
jgi:hypothetical protein